ncbi:MAG: hypothetical protein JXP73_11355 [Deltaproteobacteria bacterium]|nr:hypothetical protein [Deltaproteobacteria bacterium]
MLALRNESGRGTPAKPAAIDSVQERAKSERAIVCAACATVITSQRHRIAVHGSHEHRFMNPAGFLFHIGCFAEAKGCTVEGPPSLEYPWFRGYAWRFALCGQCGQHLGWHFLGDAAESFFGLILDRIRD